MAENESTPLPASLAGRPKRTVGCIGILLTAGLVMMILCAGLTYFSLRGSSLVISEETTYITEPLKSSDERQVDYFAAWELEVSPEGMATDRNGYRLMVQHLGASPDASPEHYAEICKKLGLDANSITPDMQLEDPHDYLEVYVDSDSFDPAIVDTLLGNEPAETDPASDDLSPEEEYGDELYGASEGSEEFYEVTPSAIDVLTSRLGRAWTLDDLPMMELWLAENDTALDLIHEAVQKPAFHIPHVRSTEDDMLVAILLPDIQYERSFARALSARAHYRIGTGDIDGAIDDIVACKRLGRHIAHDGILIEILVGIAIEGIADSIGVAGSLEHPPTKEQLQRLLDELNDLPPGGDVAKAMRFERFASLDVVQAMAFGNDTMAAEMDIPDWMPRFGLDWNVIARRLNQHHDTLVAGGNIPNLNTNPMAVVSSEARSEMLADILGALLLPAVDAVKEATRRSLCVDRMRRISLAMLMYEADHGTLPPLATADADGNRLHSWRVELLPYLGQQTLYDQIRHDEPWDSEHNTQFHNQAVSFYQCPSATLTPGQTTYAVTVGREMPFLGATGKRLADFGLQSASMILVVEGLQPVCWMDPSQDIPQDLADTGIHRNDGQGGEIASNHPGGANFGLRDGSCQFLSENIDAETLKGLLRGTIEEIP